jgi:hypothetical protein
MNKKIKIQFAVGIILILAFLVGGAFWFGIIKIKKIFDNTIQQPIQSRFNQSTDQIIQSEDTADWQTYWNIKDGYKIKYPDCLGTTIRKGNSYRGRLCNMDSEILSLGFEPIYFEPSTTINSSDDRSKPKNKNNNSALSRCIIDEPFGISINTVINSKKLSAESWVNQECQNSKLLKEETQKRNIEIDGNKTIEYHYKDRHDDIKYIVIAKNDMIYFISSSQISGTDTHDQYSQILSTFKFLENQKNQPKITSGHEIDKCIKDYPQINYSDCIKNKSISSIHSDIALFPNEADREYIKRTYEVAHKAVIAHYRDSQTDCKNSWSIIDNGKIKKVDQKEFCEYIVNYNHICDNCLLEFRYKST